VIGHPDRPGWATGARGDHQRTGRVDGQAEGLLGRGVVFDLNGERLVSTLVGVPVISVDSTPKNLAIFNPAGSLPLTTFQVKGVGPEPPLEESPG